MPGEGGTAGLGEHTAVVAVVYTKQFVSCKQIYFPSVVGSQETHGAAAEQRTSWCKAGAEEGRAFRHGQSAPMVPFEMKRCSECGRVNKARKSFAV